MTMNLVWTLVLLALGIVVLGYHFLQLRAALLPKRGTLEWISLDEKQPFSAACKTPVYSAQDILPMVLTGLLGLIISAAFVLRGLDPAAYLTADTFSKIELWLYAIVLPVVATLCSYCAAKRISATTVIASMTAVVTALDVTDSPAMLSLWLLALAFLMRWWGSQKEGLLDLSLAAAFLALGSYFAPSTALFALVLLLAVILGGILRRRSFLRILLSALGFAAAYGVLFALICVPAMMVQTGKPFPQMLFTAEFWAALGFASQQHFGELTFSFTPLLDSCCFAIQCYGVFCIVAAVYAAIRRSELDGFLLVLLALGCFVLMLFDLAPASVSALILLPYVWKQFYARERAFAANAFFTAICIVTFAADLNLFIFM